MGSNDIERPLLGSVVKPIMDTISDPRSNKLDSR